MKEITLKRFCSKCGQAMIGDWNQTWFNQKTGEQEGSIRWQCPANINRFFSWGHDFYLSDMEGSTYSYEF